MRTAVKIVILASTTAAVAAAIWKRRRIAEVAADTVEVAKAAKTAAVHIVEAVGGSLSEGTIRRAMKYNIPALVDQYRKSVPFGVAMAMMEHESNFDPTIYNYTGNGCTKKLCVGHWTGPGSRIGGGANGLYQIMSHLIKDYGVASVDALFDPETNIRAALSRRDANVKKIVAAVPDASGVLLAWLVYFSHAEGLGKLTGGKYTGAFTVLKSDGKPVTIGTLTDLPWGSSGWWSISNKLSGITRVAKRSLLWEAAKPQLMSGTLDSLRVLAGLGLMTADGGRGTGGWTDWELPEVW